MEVPRIFQNTTHYILQVRITSSYLVASYTMLVRMHVVMSIPLQYSAVINPESIRHVHHMLLYLCDGMNLTGHPDVSVSQVCDGIAEEIQACQASTVIAAWAVGGNVRDQ